MGWASGSGLVVGLAEILVDEALDDITRRRIYERVIPLFESFDWDTQDEAFGVDEELDIILIKDWDYYDPPQNPEDEEEYARGFLAGVLDFEKDENASIYWLKGYNDYIGC